MTRGLAAWNNVRVKKGRQPVLQFYKYKLRSVKNTHTTEHYSEQKEEKDNNI